MTEVLVCLIGAVFVVMVGFVLNLARAFIETTHRGSFDLKKVLQEFIDGIPTTLIITGSLFTISVLFGLFITVVTFIVES